MTDRIDEFLAARPVAVAGASSDRAKFGNIILRNLRARGWQVFAVNPNAVSVEGEPAYASFAECPEAPALAVMATPPAVTIGLLEKAKSAGVGRVWFQEGSWSREIIDKARVLGLEEVHDACIMVMAAARS